MMSGDPDHIRVSVFPARQPLRRIAAVALIAGYPADNIGLTQALIWTIPFPRLICAVIYPLLYWSYPRTRLANGPRWPNAPTNWPPKHTCCLTPAEIAVVASLPLKSADLVDFAQVQSHFLNQGNDHPAPIPSLNILHPEQAKCLSQSRPVKYVVGQPRL